MKISYLQAFSRNQMKKGNSIDKESLYTKQVIEIRFKFIYKLYKTYRLKLYIKFYLYLGGFYSAISKCNLFHRMSPKLVYKAN